MIGRASILTAAAFVMAAAVLADGNPQVVPLRVSVVRAGATQPASNESIPLRVSARGFERVIDVVDGVAEVLVPTGVVHAEPASDDYWSATTAVHVQTEGQTLAVSLVPAGTVRVRFLEPKELREPLRLLFERTSDGEPASGSSRCRHRSDAWLCTVPAGTFDLRLRATGFVTAYTWGTTVAAGKTTDLGDVRLQPGASVVGRVDVAKLSAAEVQRTTVTALAASERVPTPVSAPVNARGIFHLDGVAPGTYALKAGAPGYLGIAIPVDVIEGRESSLLEPLRLERPAALQFALTPPQTSAGKRWHVRLDRISEARREPAVATESAADADGQWLWRGVPGTYEMTVQTPEGDAVHWQRVALAPEGTLLAVPIDLEDVSGRVTLGGEPLQATLHFGSEGHYHRVTVRSDEDGRFTATVPRRTDPWRVTVVSDVPSLRRTIEVDPASFIEIDLPDRRVTGTIVDPQGAPVENAIVNLDPAGGDARIQVNATAGGLFEATGLPLDRYEISVDAWPMESDPVEVSFGENEKEKRVALVTRPARLLRGRVVSRGRPLAGAQVHPVPVGGARYARTYDTGEDGTFAASMPKDARLADVAVSLPGFAHAIGRVAIRPESLLTIQLQQNGGTMIADVPRSMFTAGGDRVYLAQGEARVDLWFASRWGTRKPLDDDRVEVTIPQMGPGPYQLCVLPPYALTHMEPFDESRCSSGVLAPFGELHLSVQ